MLPPAQWSRHLDATGVRVVAPLEARYRVRRLAGARGAVLCGPELPLLPDVLWKVLRALGLAAVDRPGPDVVAAVHFSRATHAPPWPVPGAVNARCLDISKSRVDAAQRAALGYGTAVDPRTYAGPMVRKGEGNARHDGALVQGPVAIPEPGAVYQRRIDTESRPGVLEELRVPVVGGAIPFAYRKRRPAHDVLGHGPSRAEIVPPPPEAGAVLAVCAALGLELGEVDVLRDARDGFLHVVDANPAPWGPPRTLGPREAGRAVRLLAAAFARAHLAPGDRRAAERVPAWA